MSSSPVLLLVEGPTDEQIVTSLLRRAGFPEGAVRVFAPGGGRPTLELADRLSGLGRLAVLVDADELSLPDAEARARGGLGEGYSGDVYAAVPEVEAWLLADDQLLAGRVEDDPEARAIVRRLPLPEEIPSPARLLRDLFGRPWQRGSFIESYVAEMDLGRAAARSPSLRRFLEGLATSAGVSWSADEGMSRTLSRDLLSGLLSELPADTVAWRSSSGVSLTAAQLRQEIADGTALGRQYAADLLRVSRDLLRRKAASAGT